MTAKGIEDTAFYRYVRLLALNDVGGDPGRWGVSVDDFHAGNLERARRFPENLLVTQTHDTKRSGDARARIGALSAMAEGWATCVRRWYELTDELVEDGAPDGQERYLIFQTLVGVWPITPERLEGYVEKALREAKRNTNWVDQNHDWEERVKRFAVALLHARAVRRVLRAVRRGGRGGRASARRSASCCSSSPCPACPTSTRATSSSTSRSSTPTTAGRWTGTRGARRSTALQDGAEPTRETMKLHLISRALELRGAAAGGVRRAGGAYAPIEAGPDVVAFSRGRRRGRRRRRAARRRRQGRDRPAGRRRTATC